MARSTRTADEARAQILKLCAKEFRTPRQLADALGKSVHTVRAYYVYRMVSEGLLVTRLEPGSRHGQAYRKA